MKTGCRYSQLLLLATAFFVSGCQQSGENPSSSQKIPSSALKENGTNLMLDKSPLDITYYPVDYPKLKMSGKNPGPLVSRVIYSRPSVDGRQIFGILLKYGSPWRLGANEATEIEFFTSVSIQDKKIDPGRYVMYCKPYPDHWTIILNSDLFTWGLRIDSTKDLYQFNIPVSKLSYSMPVFTMEFKNTSQGAGLLMGWDSIQAMLQLQPYLPTNSSR